MELIEVIKLVLQIFGFVTFILIPVGIKGLTEVEKFKKLHREFKQENSELGERLSVSELKKLMEQAGIVFRTMSRLF